MGTVEIPGHEETPMLIAQLSDPHVTTGPLAAEPASGLHRALGTVLALRPRPECVVVTGDLTAHGRPDEYLALREIVGRFPLPIHLATGNHDDRESLLDTFGGTPHLAGGFSAHYHVDHPDATLVVLDSLAPAAPAGGSATSSSTGSTGCSPAGRRRPPSCACTIRRSRWACRPPTPSGSPMPTRSPP
ncbi:metallophosphoesterase [Micromonospora robiginosa]|uniref:Metallophosphoesterase n=1 Tax=Micromonospora robiginosa TaxID=2749844 RepID=A0AAF0SX35_9ACTN|nr:metallophosphoesterase [Micromonospora ferruginea]WMF04616.1 metallophosphoesterase [Micromonospora ferruginea]